MTDAEQYSTAEKVNLSEMFHEVSVRLGEYYECSQDLDRLQPIIVDDDESRGFPVCLGGRIELNPLSVEVVHSQLVTELGIDSASYNTARRMYVGMGLAAVVASSQISRYAAEGKHQRYADELREFFASHTAVDRAFSEIFPEDELRDRSYMTNIMSDKQATAVNGLRLRLRLLLGAYAESEDYHSLPTVTNLTDSARGLIRRRYDLDGGVYTDVSVVGLCLSAGIGDQMFFRTLPDWVIAMAAPMTETELLGIQSEAWRQQ